MSNPVEFSWVEILPEGYLTNYSLPVGANRSAGPSALLASTDREAAAAWLASFHASPHTLANARKEIERLWLWAAEVRGQPLSGLAHEDLLAYQSFLADPQPRERWVSRGHFARQHPSWRPFAQRDPARPPLSPASQRQALIVLDSLFRWLIEAGYLTSNPLQLSRRNWRKARTVATPGRATWSTTVTGRWLTVDEWQAVGTAIEAMPHGTARELDHYGRARWLFALLYLAELRIAEVAHTPMGQFRAQMERGRERWWLIVHGKGGIARNVAVVPDLLEELTRYRESHGLPRWPAPGEAIPLVGRVGRPREPLTASALHKIIKGIFQHAVTFHEDANPGIAHRLTQASAHWLRHSGASHMLAAGVSITDVRDQLGHASIATTNTYVHTADRNRHDQLAERHGLGWEQVKEN